MFTWYVTGKKGVSNDVQKQALLLHVANMDIQEIYFTSASDGGDMSFDATLLLLDNYFAPELNTLVERHFLRQISQESGETLDQFVSQAAQT